MNLTYPDLNLTLELQENQVLKLSIENQKIFSNFTENLWRQTNGQEGSFLLAEKEKLLPLEKNCLFITNPLAVDCNEKKVLTKLYQELAEQVAEKMMLQQNELNSQMQQFIEQVIETVPYHLVYNDAIEVPLLLKSYDTKIYTDATSLLERIIDYLRAMHQICKYSIAFFLNLRQFLSKEETEQLYEFCFYEKIFLVVVEGYQSENLPQEKAFLIDSDLCIIEM